MKRCNVPCCVALIVLGFVLIPNPNALDVYLRRRIAWALLAFGVLGVLGFDLWLFTRVAQ